MFNYCKLCKECLLLYFIEPDFSCYKCHLCSEYHLLLNSNMNKIWEDLHIKNLRLVVGANNIANFQIKDENTVYMKTLYSFPLNELTHELAVQWVNKLKIFVIFQ